MPINNSVHVNGTAATPAATHAANASVPELQKREERRRPASGDTPGMPPSHRQRRQSSPDLHIPTAQTATSAERLERLAADVTNTANRANSTVSAASSTADTGMYSTAFSSATVVKARMFVTAALDSAITCLNGLTEQNRDPDLAGLPVMALDAMLVPALIAAENHRNPGLNLVALHTSTTDCRFDDGPPPIVGSRDLATFMETVRPGRYRAIIDDGTHTRAADIRKTPSGSSIVVVDPLREEQDENEYDDYADNFGVECGETAKCAFIPLDLQKATFGCRIFSISLALKMHDRESVFEKLHDVVRDGTPPDALISRAKWTDKLGSLLVLDAGPLVDARMMKHSHSRSSVKRYLEANPGQAGTTVNKRLPPETLATRMDRHRVTREVPNVVTSESNASAKKSKIATFSNSIEIKRIAMLKRAISYIESAPPNDVVRLAVLLSKARPADYPRTFHRQ